MEETGQEVENKALGCPHYKRKCKLVAPCCNKKYICRFCHDENEDHTLERKEVKRVECLGCNKEQDVNKTCADCGVTFGQYFCNICNLFDDEDKKQFHCEGCGICRVGGRDKFFHCNVCNMCLPIKLAESHKCIVDVSHANCPICLEDLHTSRIPSQIPHCGHLLHRTCFESMLHNGIYTCPLCNESMVNMNKVWKHLDAEVAETPMPIHLQIWILCRDCHKESEIFFHVVGLKCTHCGSYNTCRSKGSPVPVDNDNIVDYSQSNSDESTSSIQSNSNSDTLESKNNGSPPGSI